MANQTTLYLPSGNQVRSTSKRRFIIVRDHEDPARCYIAWRSNDILKARDYCQGSPNYVLFDTIGPVMRYDSAIRRWVTQSTRSQS
jgi:hypothetical protein